MNLKRQATIDKENPPIFQSLCKFNFACLDPCQGLCVGEVSLWLSEVSG